MPPAARCSAIGWRPAAKPVPTVEPKPGPCRSVGVEGVLADLRQPGEALRPFRASEPGGVEVERPAGAVPQVAGHRPGGHHDRSEEHTSELQSLMRTSYAVFCLKNNNQQQIQHLTTSNS